MSRHCSVCSFTLNSRQKAFKNGDPSFRNSGIIIPFCLDRPSDTLSAPKPSAKYIAKESPVTEPVRNKIRYSQKIHHVPGKGQLQIPRKFGFWCCKIILCQLSPYQFRAMLFQPCNTSWVKGLNAEYSRIEIQRFTNRFTQGCTIASFRLQLNDQRCISGK